MSSSGLDVRFSYDNTKLKTSNLTTNEVTNDVSQYFQLEEEFQECLDFFTTSYDMDETIIRGVLSFNPPTTESEHIINKDDIGYVINTDGGVLLGKMSFQMTEDKFDETWFQLVENSESYPHTGIKINLDGTNNYQAQSTFKFTNATLSDNADLTNIKLSKNIVDEENPENTTYKEYALTPKFHKDTLNYEVELLDLIDTMDITATLDDENASIELYVPERNADNKLMYESDGETIKYVKKDITSDQPFESGKPFEFTLNKLGEPDTVLKVKVTAQDGETTKEYKITIKRPYGTIKGTIQLGETLREQGERLPAPEGPVYVEYVADIKVYKTGQFDWEKVIAEDSAEKIDYSGLDNLKIIYEDQSEKDEGKFEIYLPPGNYDVFLEKAGFTQIVHKDIPLRDGYVIDIKNNILHEGDVDRDGIVSISDLTDTINKKDGNGSDPGSVYDEKFDFMKKGSIAIQDVTSVKENLDNRRQLVIK